MIAPDHYWARIMAQTSVVITGIPGKDTQPGVTNLARCYLAIQAENAAWRKLVRERTHGETETPPGEWSAADWTRRAIEMLNEGDADGQ